MAQEQVINQIAARHVRAPRGVAISLAAPDACAWLILHPLVMPEGSKLAVTLADGTRLEVEG